MKVRFFSLILLTVGSLAATAAFACPTAADMTTNGVWVKTDDGGAIHYRREGESVIVERAVYPGEEDVETRSYRGVYFLNDATLKNGDIVPGDGTRYVYQDLETLPDPDTDGNWSGDVKVFTPGTAEASNDKMLVTRGTPIEISVGGCKYFSRVIVVSMTFQDGGTWLTQYNYLPDLGIALFSAAGKDLFSLEAFYRSVSISATRP